MSEIRAAARGRGLTVAAVIAALALAAHAGIGGWHEARSLDLGAFGQPGELVAVTLVGGQVYYGELRQARAQALSLARVYYVQTFANAATQQTDNRLVNRGRADWHQPAGMTIPMDKVLLVERIGADSRLAGLIAQDQKGQAGIAK